MREREPSTERILYFLLPIFILVISHIFHPSILRVGTVRIHHSLNKKERDLNVHHRRDNKQ